jgi:glycogen debranching enzyme
MSWIDTCLQQELAARCLVEMNTALAGPHDAADMSEEAAFLRRLVNRRMWDRKSGYYFDRLRDGDLNGVKSVAAYWALLAGTARGARQDRLIAHLENPSEFDRPHRVPSLSADHPLYKPGGDYWRGSVWAPANFMVLRGLRAAGRNDLAHTIALNHLRNVLEVFEQTGTFWENYAPESAARGEQSARDFVGWTGLVPIAVLLEFVLGLEPDALRGTLRWDVRLVEAHGVKRYPWGTHGSIDLECGRRQSTSERPVIRARSTVPVTVEVCWESGRDRIRLRPEPEQGE